MAAFKPRTTKPEAGNPYYNTVGNGGYSSAIKGQPTDPGCDVLANCVGYAYGRFNEIGEYGCCKYLWPTNAENFMEHAKDLEIGMTPKLGACMVWRKGATLSGSDGAGHVAIVEKILSDSTIVTSESGYGSRNPFWTQTRHKGNGNWGAGSGYTFLGFIYNPAVTDSTVTTEPEPESATRLAVNGKWDSNLTRRLQQIFGTPVDGKVSNQWLAYKKSNPGLIGGWDWKTRPNRRGSVLVKAMQKWAGMPAGQQDGEWGPATCKAVQCKLGTPADGVVSNPSVMVAALQTWANEQSV